MIGGPRVRHGRNLVHAVAYCLGLEPARTQTTAAERDLLARAARGRKTLVEIGVFEGVSSRLLREHMDAGAELFCIDPLPSGRLGFSPQYLIACRELSRCQVGRATLIRKWSFEVAAEWRRPIDLLYYDAEIAFEPLSRDFRDWSPFLAPDALFLLHTSRSSPAKPVAADAGTLRFVAELPLRHPGFEVAEQVDSITAIRRRPDA